MQFDDFETTLKCVVLGNGMVGKSSMARQFCEGTFTDVYKKTIGADFMEKQFMLDEVGESVHMMVWDTAGQEEFDALTRGYYKGAGAALLVFSTTDRDSFSAITHWHSKIVEECGTNIAIALVENKIDRIRESVVSPDEVEALATQLNLKLYRVSCKNDINVTEVFRHCATKFITQGMGSGDGAVQAVASIGDFQTQESKDQASKDARKDADTFGSTGSKQTRAGGKPNGGGHDGGAGGTGGGIRLNQPSKVRTKGKKKMLCNLL